MKETINIKFKILYSFLCLSLLIGFYFGEDSSGGGSKIDFYSTWQLVVDPFTMKLTNYDFKFPLHYILGSLIYKITESKYYLRLTYVILTFFLPLLFYECLKIRLYKIDRNILFFFSLVLLILPAVRSAAIWANTHITGLFFFLFSIYYYLKWEKDKINNYINLNLFLNLLFLALAVYTRQIYALVYLFFLFIYLKRLDFKTFLKVCLIIFSFSIPGLYYVYLFPIILTVSFDASLYNSILVNLSIISFYYFPYSLIILFNKKKIKLDLYFIIFALFSFLFILFLAKYFNYNYKQGGGILMKFSLILFNNYIIFFITSFIGLISCYVLCEKKIENYFLSLLIVLGISSFFIPQKYFEPMMIIILFLIYQNSSLKIFFNKNLNSYLLFLYYLSYLISVLVLDYYNFKKYIILN